MIIKYFGHDEFMLETADGIKILTDPYDPEMLSLPTKNHKVDIVTVSHLHGDHSYVKKAVGHPMVLASEIDFDFDVLRISAIKSFHDENQGALRGENLIFLYETEGLRLAHLGDLGHIPNDKQIEFLRDLDILFLPIGGKYTIDAKAARQTAQILKPRVIIPMHYKLENGGLKDIKGLDVFLQEMQNIKTSYVNLLRVTKQDISELAPITVINPDL
ncbi:MAG: MBL fold metallo-hydrolase [Eubacteriales bacterium]|nr:MBL fold metallo-hydrolase [Eubacteriales bacterium]